MANNIVKKLQLDMTVKLERNTRGAISCVVAREVLPDKGIFGQRLEWMVHSGKRESHKGPAVGNTKHVQGSVRAQGPSVSGRCDNSIWFSNDDTLPGSLSLPHPLSSLTPSFFVTGFHISFSSEFYPFYVLCQTVTWHIFFFSMHPVGLFF